MEAMTERPANADVTECERQCSEQQRALVACVNSIRDAGASGGGDAEKTSGGGDNKTNSAAIAATQASCLSVAVMAWTRCCENANEGRV